MTTYQIGPYEIVYAQYMNALNNSVFLFTVNNAKIYVYDFDTWWVDYLNSGMPTRPHQPSEYHYWDGIEEEWVIDQGLFDPVFKEALATYRDGKIENVVTYTNGSSEEFSVTNGARTRAALNDIANAIPLKNDENATVDFKTLDGFKSMSASDAQGLFLKCVDWQQKCFSAEKAVLEKHELTPYEDATFATMQADFDTEVGA